MSDALEELETLKEEMTEWRDNLEEKFSHTDKYAQVSDAVDSLEFTMPDQPDDPDGLLVELSVTVSILVPTRKRQRTSRAVRRDNAVRQIRETIEAIGDFLDANDCDASLTEEWEQYVEDLEDIVDTVEAAEFPGAFG